MSISGVAAAGTAAIAQQIQSQTAQANNPNQTGITDQAAASQQTGRAHHHRHHGGGETTQTQQAAATEGGTASGGTGSTVNTVA